MTELSEFESFQKIPRLSREVVITEKIDGTNAQVCVHRAEVGRDGAGPQYKGLWIKAGSRSRWITPEDDNHGFAKWVEKHKEELIDGLGEGRHYGEWWGSGIQRGYGLTKSEKRFSLFNTSRWTDATKPACCHVVPELWRGPFNTITAEHICNQLAMQGSQAAPGFKQPEGIIIFHTGGNLFFKKTIEKDEEHKSIL